MAGNFANSAAAIDVILTQEANRIGSDIHKATMHTSPWIDLIKQTTFPEGMGYQLNTLIYDRALPLKSGTLAANPELGVSWKSLQTNTTSGVTGFTDGQSKDIKAMADEGRATLDFTKKLKPYSLKKAVVESPRINVEDLRYAAHRTDQLRAIMDLMSESVRHSWENRYRDEYDRLADNCVLAGKGTTGTTAASKFITGGEDKQTFAESATAEPATVKTGDVDEARSGSDPDIDANISNALMDKIYFQLIRGGAGPKAYGRENGRPIFSVVLSSEASFQLQTESEAIRDDIRYNSARVGELIAPLGVEKSFRGFYHLVDDLTTRYTYNTDKDTLLKVEPYTVSNGVVIPNTAYESASYEAAYVLVDDVMESLIPSPISGDSGLTFDPVNYKGDFKWTNIADAAINPDKTIGFFRGIMASASKPIKTNFGYVIIFKRDAAAADVATI